jgi:sugar fermentation stimulation protein A
MILEVKSCTLFGRELAMFPDAVTDRGRRHLMELAALSRQGLSCGVVFVVSAPRTRLFLPDYHTDFAFARALLEAKNILMIKAIGIHWQDNLTLGEDIRDIPIPWSLLEREGHDRGCYLLILHLPEDRTLTIGGLGDIFFPKGYYLYAGSARKNLAKRLERHCRRRKSFFWHIDYLRDKVASCVALPIRTGDPLEHELARAIGRMAAWSVPRFGSSDCRCASHLFGMTANPLHNSAFIELLQYFRMDRLEGD